MADHSRLGRGPAALIGDVGDGNVRWQAADASCAARPLKICGLIRATRAACSPIIFELGELSELDP